MEKSQIPLKKEYPETVICFTCKQLLDLSKYYKYDGYIRQPCKSCAGKACNNRRRANKSKSLCFCGRKPSEGKKTCDKHLKVWSDDYYKKYREDNEWMERQNRNSREQNKKLKREVCDKYGGICACCGESAIEFLSIDHIVQVGQSLLLPRSQKKTRRGTKNGEGKGIIQKRQGGRALYLKLKKNNYPDGFRVLCLNCNFSIGHYGYCPHHNLPEDNDNIGCN